MALPKKRHSRARRDRRRANDGLSVPGRSKCSNCDRDKTPHRVCPHCGYYKGRVVVVSDED
ncbi:MAG TPA: 50S ribosomal protein L32 [Acidobacteriota bacterium]|nr:50S ribosomal protein L32 [Acidobacteriota bacterium]HJO30335.1 50S ribosomal protein L32 [Acidobacteriota bacterium]